MLAEVPSKALKTERQKKIFEAVVLDYIRTGEPVASGNLADRYSFELSPASIRKVLHELEEQGLLRQAHSSAGRTPTEEGFRVYADDILEVKKLPQSMRAQIKKELSGADFSPEKLFTLCSKVLSNLTSHMGVVMAPGLSSLALKKLYFVRIGTRQILSVLMTQNGIIQNKLLTTAEDFSQEALNEVNFFLDEKEPPFTLDEIRNTLLSDMMANRTEFEDIFRRAFILASEISESESPDPDESRNIYMDEEGRVRLIEHPDFKDAEAMRALFRTFENKRRLVDLLNEITDAGKVRVVIGPSGEESDGLTLVASPYLSGTAKGGALGILGPRRLNYSEIVPVVDYAAQVLSGLFSK
ncbi:MAG: heat-inducible transcriptional repressor HrcA [Deltaproteobacteria bacterium]|jgi:heat-inducible transcriptional repressor|nr:heat-inducible transcriptional repressor HrcA [Deltaproteobacteria bacterium]